MKDLKEFVDPPFPLFESEIYNYNYVCLVCGSNRAKSGLFSTKDFQLTIPLCKHCCDDFNWYGYYILKKIRVKSLIWNLFKFKLCHWNTISWLRVIKLLYRMNTLSKQMRKWEKLHHE